MGVWDYNPVSIAMASLADEKVMGMRFAFLTVSRENRLPKGYGCVGAGQRVIVVGHPQRCVWCDFPVRHVFQGDGFCLLSCCRTGANMTEGDGMTGIDMVHAVVVACHVFSSYNGMVAVSRYGEQKR